MDATDVIYAETMNVVENGTKEEMEEFINVLGEAIGELENALYEIAVGDKE